MIYRRKPGRTFDAILKLHVIDQNRDNLSTCVDRRDRKSEEKDELEAAAAPLKAPGM